MEKKDTKQWKWFGWWFPKVTKPYKYWKLHEVMAFHDIRFQFIYYRNLPMDFRFSSFLRKIKANTFIELVEIHWTHFLFMLGITLLDIARVVSRVDFGPFFEPAFLIAESILNMVLVTMLGWKIRKIYWKMTRNPATYYDQVDRHSLEMERLIESELKKIKNESQPQSRRMSKTFERKSVDNDADVADDETVIRKSVDMDRPRMSTDRRSRRASHAGSQSSKHDSHGHGGGHGAGAHKPIYQNLAYVPPKSIPSSGTVTPSAHEDDHGLDNVVARHSLDVNRETIVESNKASVDITTADRPSARSSFDKPRKYEPGNSLTNKDGSIAMDAVANAAARRRNEGRSSIEASGRFSRTSQDGPPRRLSNASRPDRRVSRDRRDSNASRRTSVDLSMTLPVEDLASRTKNTRKLKVKKQSGSGSDPMVVDLSDDEAGLDNIEMRKLALKRLKQKERPNPGLVNLHKENEAAKTAAVETKYPKWLVKCLPRLGRIASPAEKLFWFGSPKFYLWCVEWVLFFTTVNLATTLAKVGTAAKKINSPPEKIKAGAKMLVFSVHQKTNTTAKPAAGYPLEHPPELAENFMLLGIALLVACIALFYVLFRIADVMKKYIFVLNNANMIPESMTIEAIQTIRVKDAILGGGGFRNNGDESPNNYAYVDGSDTEVEDGEYAKGRHDLTSFFNKEVQGGRQPGALPIGDAKEENPRRVSVSSRRTSEQIDEVEAVAETNDWDGRAEKV